MSKQLTVNGLYLKEETVLFTGYDLIPDIHELLDLKRALWNTIIIKEYLACKQNWGSVGSTCAGTRSGYFSLLWVKVTIWILNSGLFFNRTNSVETNTDKMYHNILMGIPTVSGSLLWLV